MSGLALSLDVGTSSARALLWDLSGREVDGARAQVKYAMRTTPDGGVEMPAQELEEHVAECIDQLMAQAASRAQPILAVGMSTFWHSFAGLNGAGEPVTPVYNWADNRPAAAALELRKLLDAEAVHQRTGCYVHPSYYPARLTWLRETQPALFQQVERWASPSEYLFSRWFGKAASVSVSMASATGFMNQATCRWDSETLKAVHVDERTLAPIEDLSVRSQGLQPRYAARWPALRDVPFFPAVGDGACGNVGSGAVDSGKCAVNLGTSGAIRVVWDERMEPRPHTPPGLWRYRVDESRPLMGAAFSDGGIVYQWMSRTLSLPPAPELEQALAAMPPGGHGLTFLPFLAGERSMGWNPSVRALLAGMNLDTNPVEILRAAMEAVALRFALALQALKNPFPAISHIVASGGALGASPAWTQMFADALDQPVAMAAEPEASSRGAAMLALQVAGAIRDLPAPRLGAAFQPRAQHAAAFRQMLERQQQLYPAAVGGPA